MSHAAAHVLPSDFLFESLLRRRLADAGEHARAEFMIAVRRIITRATDAYDRSKLVFGISRWRAFVKASRCAEQDLAMILACNLNLNLNCQWSLPGSASGLGLLELLI